MHATADEAGHRAQATSSGKSVRFVELSRVAVTALLEGASRMPAPKPGVALTRYFLTDDELRLDFAPDPPQHDLPRTDPHR